MNYPASILILVFLAVTFITSAHDKLFHWNDNVSWLKGHFAKTIIKDFVPASLGLILLLELIAGVLSVLGVFQIFISGERTFGFYGAVFSSVTLLFLLLGQRLAKEYDGARTIAIYFIPAVLAVYWLG
ncbi:MAG: DoxX family protein [Flavobacterium sp.]|jgi:hypothetical protein|nr:DoxX family protein [Flavobacterium sp.]MBP6099506.1 DoxX family protein [Flavobacterium sp.]